MKRLILLILLGAAAASRAADALPPATDLLQGCIRALPDVPLVVRGELQSKSKDGDLERKLNVEMTLDWRTQPATARYTLRDAFGKSLSHLSLTWPSDGPVDYRFLAGDPLGAAPVPDLSAPIEGTDISWQDLSLAFLWWSGGETVGGESVRGRDCYVVDLPKDDLVMRLWIDPKIPVLLRAETWRDGAVTRRMDVKGFKKINDRWVIHNVEIESLPSRHKTLLVVRDVEDRTRKDYIKVDNAAAEEVVEPVTAIPDPAPAGP